MMGERKIAKDCIEDFSRLIKHGGKMIVSTLAPGNFFVRNSKKLSEESYFFQGKEVKKKTEIEYSLFIPKDEGSYAKLFPEDCKVQEIGTWDNNYCGVQGRHFVALVTKK